MGFLVTQAALGAPHAAGIGLLTPPREEDWGGEFSGCFIYEMSIPEDGPVAWADTWYQTACGEYW